MAEIKELLDKKRIKFINSKNKKDALNEIIDLFIGDPKIDDIDKVREAIMEREKIISTGIGLGIAVPHAKIESVKDFVMAIGISKKGVEFESLDNQKVHIIVMILGPAHKHKEYLEILAKIILFLKNRKNREKIMSCNSTEEIYNLFMEAPCTR